MQIVPANDVIAELKAKLSDCERRMKDATESAASELKEDPDL